MTIVTKGKEFTHHGANKKLEKPSAQGMAAEKESYSEFVQKCLSTANTGTSLLGTKKVFSELPLDTFILKVYFWKPLSVMTLQKYPQNPVNVL